jgi:hypothetical protein
MAAAPYQLLRHMRYESTNSSLALLIAVLLRIQVFHDEKIRHWVSGYRHDEHSFQSAPQQYMSQGTISATGI